MRRVFVLLQGAAAHFAAHYGTKITPCRAGDAKRKGKVERCFRQLRESFVPEVEAAGVPAGVGELNRRARLWLDGRATVSARRGPPGPGEPNCPDASPRSPKSEPCRRP